MDEHRHASDSDLLEQIRNSASLSKLYEKFDQGGPREFLVWLKAEPPAKQSYKLVGNLL